MSFSIKILAGINKNKQKETLRPNVEEKYQKLEPDLKRIALMEQNIAEFHHFFESSILEIIGYVLRNQFKPYYFIRPPAWRIALRSIISKDRALPQFTSTGVVRSGTSSMSNYIMQHPAILLPIAKELNANIPKLSFIKAQFPTNREMEKVRAKYGAAMTGDCSPVMPSMTALHWLKTINPDMKIVVTLRNPAERTISHWRWYKLISSRFDKDPLWHNMPEIEAALQMEMEDFYRGTCGFTTFSGTGGTGFIRHSCYLPFLKQLFNQVPKEHVHFVVAEEFFRNPNEITKEVYRFLGLPEYEPVEVKETNPSPNVEVPDSLHQELADFFKPLNEELYEFLGRDLGWESVNASPKLKTDRTC